ncbi:MAG: hypothetical protein LUD52_01735 [Opitutae bacterium]|nr:hypothetical protein [Opitutae bacterium]
MKKPLFFSIFCVACAVALTGCTSHITDLTMITTRDIGQEKISVARSKKQRMVVGESARYVFLIFPIGIPKLNEAVDDALEQGGGDLIVDVGIYRTSWTAIIVSRIAVEVRGTVVNTKEAAE